MKSSASEPGLNYRKLPLVVSPGLIHLHEGLFWGAGGPCKRRGLYPRGLENGNRKSASKQFQVQNVILNRIQFNTFRTKLEGSLYPAGEGF